MSNDKMREEFEAEYARYAAISVEEVSGEWDGDLYGDQGMRDAWWAWQASRAALAIELPELYDWTADQVGVFQDDDGTLFDAGAVIEAIEAAGLKVSP
jgi:hypothetical protein